MAGLLDTIASMAAAGSWPASKTARVMSLARYANALREPRRVWVQHLRRQVTMP